LVLTQTRPDDREAACEGFVRDPSGGDCVCVFDQIRIGWLGIRRGQAVVLVTYDTLGDWALFVVENVNYSNSSFIVIVTDYGNQE